MGLIGMIISMIFPFLLIGIGNHCKTLSELEKDNGTGYRTKRANKDTNTWREANKYFSEAISTTANIYLAVGLCVGVIKSGDFGLVIIINSLLLIPTIISSIIMTESHLKKHENDEH